jgi:hypothetical protein
MAELRRLRAPEPVGGSFQPQVLLPAQMLAASAARRSPEVHLMAAILDDAINCFRRYRGTLRGPGRRIFREAEKWIMSADDRWPFSFEHICGVLGIHAGCVRHELLALGDGESAEHGTAAYPLPPAPRVAAVR